MPCLEGCCCLNIVSSCFINIQRLPVFENGAGELLSAFSRSNRAIVWNAGGGKMRL